MVCSQRDIVNDKVVLLSRFLFLIFGMRLVPKAKTKIILKPSHRRVRDRGTVPLKDRLRPPPKLLH